MGSSLGRLFILIAASHGLIGNLNQPTQSRFFLDDLGIVFDVEGSRQTVGKAGQVCGPSHAFKLIGALELIFERNQVNGPGMIHEVEHFLENSPVAFEIEVLGLESLKNSEHSFIVQEYCSQNRALRLQVVGKRFLQADVGHYE